jgi:hypothetical protein
MAVLPGVAGGGLPVADLEGETVDGAGAAPPDAAAHRVASMILSLGTSPSASSSALAQASGLTCSVVTGRGRDGLRRLRPPAGLLSRGLSRRWQHGRDLGVVRRVPAEGGRAASDPAGISRTADPGAEAYYDSSHSECDLRQGHGSRVAGDGVSLMA